MTLPELGRDELYRYARHLALPEVGVDGQRRLKAGCVLCVGVGGLGSPLALYLAAAGVGTIGIVDFDTVDESNLHRQLLHGTADIGRSKLDSAEDRLRDVNPHVEIVRHDERLTSENALTVLAAYDVVVDGTDNFPTRYLVNDACVLLGTPNVYGSVFRWEGQVSVFATADGPCYRCLFREPPPPGLVPNCAEGGVLGALPGIIGTAQAMETIKLLLGVGTSLAGRLLIFDALEMRWREVGVRRNPECPVCGDEPTQTTLIDYEVFCGLKTDPAADDHAQRAGSRLAAEHLTTVEDLTSLEDTAVEDPAAVEDITAAELVQRLDGENPLFLLDVREPWEWAVSNLADRGARLIPLAELEDRLGEVPRDRSIVAYCRSGQRSRTAAHVLAAAGHPSVASLDGGLRSWAEVVDPELRVV
jgi:sulfur-carrier protein adenylyltransferase/sulfurtransferase